METKTRLGYFFVAVAIIFIILGVIWFLYDRIVVPPESGTSIVGTYQYSYTYEISGSEEDPRPVSVTLQLAFRMDEDGTAYLVATNGNEELENTKGSYIIEDNEIVYTRLFIRNDESYDLLFETNELPKKEHFLIQENSVLATRKYFNKVCDDDLSIVLTKYDNDN